MTSKEAEAKRIESEAHRDAQRHAGELLRWLEGAREAIGDPPPELLELVKRSGIDLHKPAGDDPKHSSQLEKLFAEAQKLLGDRVAEVQERVASMYDAPPPLSPTAATAPRAAKGAS